MDKYTLKYLPLAALAASTVFGGLNDESRTSQLEKQMAQVRAENSNGTYGAKNGAGNPQTDGYGLFLDLNVLYWRSATGDTVVAFSDQSIGNQLPLQGSQQQVSPAWDWGFRIGAGYNFEHDNWDGSVEYTYFRGSSSNSKTGGQNDRFIPERGAATIINPTTFTNAIQALTFASDLNINLDNIDAQLGKSYHVSEDLALRPYLGLAVSWLQVNQNTRYSGGTYLDVNSIQVNDSCKFFGMGPELGMDSKWTLGSGFSLFGNGMASLLYGNFDVRHQNWYTGFQTVNGTNHTITMDGDTPGFVPTFRMFTGLRYDQYIDNNAQHLGVALGYDLLYFFSGNQQLRQDGPGTDTTTALLHYTAADKYVAFQGLTLALTWDF